MSRLDYIATFQYNTWLHHAVLYLLYYTIQHYTAPYYSIPYIIILNDLVYRIGPVSLEGNQSMARFVESRHLDRLRGQHSTGRKKREKWRLVERGRTACLTQPLIDVFYDPWVPGRQRYSSDSLFFIFSFISTLSFQIFPVLLISSQLFHSILFYLIYSPFCSIIFITFFSPPPLVFCLSPTLVLACRCSSVLAWTPSLRPACNREMRVKVSACARGTEKGGECVCECQKEEEC